MTQKAVNVPQANFAIIGGSSMFSIQFPEDLGRSDVEMLETGLIFETPYGPSPEFKLFQQDGKRVLHCRMHGWRPNVVTRGVASQQLFWVLKEAGVKKIFVEGGVGSINPMLELRDLVVPNDYIDNSMRKDIGLGGPYLLVMRESICPTQSAALVDAARSKVAEGYKITADDAAKQGETSIPRPRHVFERGVYVNTDGRHFESPAEVQMFRSWHGDFVGQSICPEVYLAREIGACYAGIYMIVNYAEGIIKDWSHQDLSDIFYNESHTIGNILLDALTRVDDHQDTCNCLSLRKATLLKEINAEKQ